MQRRFFLLMLAGLSAGCQAPQAWQAERPFSSSAAPQVASIVRAAQLRGLPPEQGGVLPALASDGSSSLHPLASGREVPAESVWRTFEQAALPDALANPSAASMVAVDGAPPAEHLVPVRLPLAEAPPAAPVSSATESNSQSPLVLLRRGAPQPPLPAGDGARLPLQSIQGNQPERAPAESEDVGRLPRVRPAAEPFWGDLPQPPIPDYPRTGQ